MAIQTSFSCILHPILNFNFHSTQIHYNSFGKNYDFKKKKDSENLSLNSPFLFFFEFVGRPLVHWPVFSIKKWLFSIEINLFQSEVFENSVRINIISDTSLRTAEFFILFIKAKSIK